MFKIFIAIIGGLFCATGWAATYIYGGNNYSTILTGTTYNTGMRITGSFSTATPLPANLSNANIGTTGSNLIQSWSWNDGVSTYTPANSYVSPGLGLVSTDAGGSITSQELLFLSPLPPHVLGTPMSGVGFTTSLGIAIATTGAPCTTLSANACTNANGTIATGGTATSPLGRFTLAPSIVPTLIDWNLLLLCGLLVLTAAVVMRRRRST